MQNSESSSNLSRREALRLLAATSGVAALSAVPNKWQTPLVEVGALPALAQASNQAVTPVTSPADYPFENPLPEYEGDLSGLKIAPQNGWLVIAEEGQTVGAASTYDYPWIITRPWITIIRRWDIVVAPWPFVRKIKIKYRFQARGGHGSSHNIRDDVDFWFYTTSSPFPSMYYVSKVKVRRRSIEIELRLPALGSGFYPFFCSGYFPMPIYLTGGFAYDPGLYLGPGIVGPGVNLTTFNANESQGAESFDDVGLPQ